MVKTVMLTVHVIKAGLMENREHLECLGDWREILRGQVLITCQVLRQYRWMYLEKCPPGQPGQSGQTRQSELMPTRTDWILFLRTCPGPAANFLLID
jgi:hypothetical protein